eukprot:8137313-Pyramimonas_sp.AAC.1
MAECLPPELVLHINQNAVRALVFTKQAVAVKVAHMTKKPMQDGSGDLNPRRVSRSGPSSWCEAFGLL